MATQTPTDPRDSLHGEEEAKPRFGLGHGDADSPYVSPKSADELRDAVYGSGKSVSPSQLASAENQPAVAPAAPANESTAIDRLGKGFSGGGQAQKQRQPKKGRIKKLVKKRLAIVLASAVLGGGVFTFSILQGPLQFIHYAALLERFHLRDNQDFGNNRTSKVLLYALFARGAERGRLGITGNIAADKWERRLLEQTGLRPVYSQNTGRFIGFEIADDKKAFDFLSNIGAEDSRASRQLERTMGKGAEIRTVGEAKQGRQNILGSGSRPLDDSRRIIDLGKVLSYRERAKFIGTIGKATQTHYIAQTVGSRLLKKRGGVHFHFFTNQRIERAIDERFDRRADRQRHEEYKKSILKRFSDAVRNGVRKGSSTQTDRDGDSQNGADSSAAGAEASEKTNQAIEEVSQAANNGENTQALRQRLAVGGGPAIAVGVFCAVKDTGKQVEDFKYANNILPMMRLGWAVITMGSQAKSGDDINLDELGVMSGQLYDQEKRTSFASARSIQAELGQPQTGEEPPPAARLANAADKPDVFGLVDAVAAVTPLGPACDAFNAVAGLPIIRDVSGALSAAIEGTANTLVLERFGTSVNEIVAEGLAALAGESVNPLAKGAELGNLANIGAFLAGNDQAISMGGTALSNEQAFELKQEQIALDKELKQNQSFANRYLDIYEPSSLLGSLFMKTPGPTTGIAAILSKPTSVFSSAQSSVMSLFGSKASAASHAYDYGVPKFGWSIQQQQRDLFEDPYELARLVEPNLDEWNNLYGKCFGMRVTADDSGVHLEVLDEKVNLLKVHKDPDCDPSKNQDDRFNQYRFYLADAITALSLACFEGDDNACVEVGIENTSPESSGGPSENAGATIDASQLGRNSDNITCAEDTKDLGVVTTRYIGEIKKESGPLKIRLCQIPDIPGRGNDKNGNNITGGAVVDARVSGAWSALAKKAKGDGITLVSNSSFRLADSCGGTGDESLCARPGHSPHQTGLAIDFANMPGTGTSTTSCSARVRAVTPEWVWMYDNAEQFGIKQYTKEAWHWDPMPMSNRCGKTSR